MGTQRDRYHHDLIAFLRTSQKPDRQIENIGPHDSLVAKGLIDSLAIVQIVMHLETTYGIDFGGVIDLERLSTIAGILDLIESHSP